MTKKDNIPLLSLTIVTSTFSHASRVPITVDDEADGFGNGENGQEARVNLERGPDGLRETTIEQDVPVRVLRAVDVEGIHEPRCREPDVHILLPSLVQLKAISERFTKLALATSKTTSTSTTLTGLGTAGPRLELSANMHGSLKMSIKTDALRIESLWTGLVNPELDPGAVEGGEEGLRTHPSVRMKELEGEEGWARCRIDGKDWGRVLSVGRMGGRVIACKILPHFPSFYCVKQREPQSGRFANVSWRDRFLPRARLDPLCLHSQRRRWCRRERANSESLRSATVPLQAKLELTFICQYYISCYSA